MQLVRMRTEGVLHSREMALEASFVDTCALDG